MKEKEFSRRQFLIGSGMALAVPQIINSQTNTIQTDCVFCNIVAGKVSAPKLWGKQRFLRFSRPQTDKSRTHFADS